MKRKFLKKLAIFTLVGVILGSSIMSNYKQAERVEASVTATFGAGALLAMGVMAACGVVYTGIQNQNKTGWLWENDRPLYADEIARAESRLKELWNNAVANYAMNNGYDPDEDPDDNDGDGYPDVEGQPPTWDVFKKMVEEKQLQLKTVVGGVATGIGTVLKDVAKGLKEKLSKEETSPSITEAPTTFDVRLWQEWLNTKTNIDHPYFFWKESTPNIFYTFRYDADFTQIPFLKYKKSVNGNEIYSIKRSIYYFAIDSKNKIYSNKLDQESWQPVTSINDISDEIIFTNMKMVDYYDYDIVYLNPYTDNLVQDNVNYGSKYNTDDDKQQISNILKITTSAKINELLDKLQSLENKQDDTQAVIDEFLKSETSLNPDSGGNGNGSDNNEDNNNGNEEEITDKKKFTADLSKFFPFCIPFDLINAIRIFNAEPETPRVEIPIHFGIVEKDYTFVFDLKDFDGVAGVCRSMFTVLYIVGLIMVTRNLIRG